MIYAAPENDVSGAAKLDEKCLDHGTGWYKTGKQYPAFRPAFQSDVVREISSRAAGGVVEGGARDRETRRIS